MKKVLSILLVMALVATLFAGCGEDPTESPAGNTQAPGTTAPAGTTDPNATPGAETPTPNEPIVDPMTAWEPSFKDGDALMEFVVYDTDSYYAIWNTMTKALLADYGLKLGTAIAPVIKDQVSLGNYTLLQTAAGRNTYATAITNLFLEESTTPDFMPSLYASNVGASAVFKTLGSQGLLIDLAPFIAEGGVLENYTDWVWEQKGKLQEWEKAKYAIMGENEELFAIPRIEYMPTKNLIGLNYSGLEAIGKTFDDIQTWEDLEDALAAHVELGKTGFSFNKEIKNISAVLTPIANAYGIDFSVGFEWMEKNGEPLFSYYMPEYLEVLETAVRMAENNLTQTDANGIIFYAEDLQSADLEEVKKYDDDALALYGEPWHLASFKNAETRGWITRPIAAEGYTAAMTAQSIFDYSYMAITTKQVTGEGKEAADYELALRLMSYINDCATKESYMDVQFGKEGLPFGESWEQIGNYIWVTDETDGKEYVRWIASDRFGMFDDENKDNARPLNGGKAFWLTVHPLFAWLYDAIGSFNAGKMGLDDATVQGSNAKIDEKTWNFGEALVITKPEWKEASSEEPYNGKSIWDYYADGEYLKSQYNIEKSGYTTKNGSYNTYTDKTELYAWDFDFRRGIDFHADVSAFPMQYTAYHANESQDRDYPSMDKIAAIVKENNSFIYKGFFPAATEVYSSKEGTDLQKKIDRCEALAREFTINVLKTGNVSGWNAYINNLEEAGIKEIYDFYKEYAFTFVTSEVAGTKSTMSDAFKYWAEN